MEAIVSE